jgi:hypothetical protein
VENLKLIVAWIILGGAFSFIIYVLGLLTELIATLFAFALLVWALDVVER